MTDYEIYKEHQMIPIAKIAKKLGLKNKHLEYYGQYKAKINLREVKTDRKGKLILVTSINPTSSGEGKTTMSIGLADGMNLLGKKTCLALRQPSLGPVFGIKGGATGGGRAQVVPMDEINLHFTGDFHAITSANNLLSALIDNHIFQGNEQKIETVAFNRCLDMNDRALRTCTVAEGREERFNITAASEMMSILCLSENLEDLKERIGNIVIGFTKTKKPVLAKDIEAQNACAILLKDALKPNLAQTLYGNPAIVHCGPFANIAHGCNSIAATKAAMRLADYCVTEAGFGADLGAQKFLDFKCKTFGLVPSCVVVVATIKAIKLNGNGVADSEKLTSGLCNLKRHLENMKNFGMNVVCTLNHFFRDTDAEVEEVRALCVKEGIPFEVSKAFANGAKGAADLAKLVIETCEKPSAIQFTYNEDDTIAKKIEKITKKIYRAKEVEYSDEAKAQLKIIEKDYPNFGVIIAKTQYSFTDNKELLGAPADFTFHISRLEVKGGAGFIVAVSGSMMLMPGLGKVPAAVKMKMDSNGNIEGLF